MSDPRGSGNRARRAFWLGVRRGRSVEEAAAVAGVAPRTGFTWFREAGGMPPLSLAGPGTGRRLTVEDREQIAYGLASGQTFTAIGQRIGRPTSTVTREVRLNMRHRRTRQVGWEGLLTPDRLGARLGLLPEPRPTAVRARSEAS